MLGDLDGTTDAICSYAKVSRRVADAPRRESIPFPPSFPCPDTGIHPTGRGIPFALSPVEGSQERNGDGEPSLIISQLSTQHSPAGKPDKNKSPAPRPPSSVSPRSTRDTTLRSSEEPEISYLPSPLSVAHPTGDSPAISQWPASVSQLSNRESHQSTAHSASSPVSEDAPQT